MWLREKDSKIALDRFLEIGFEKVKESYNKRNQPCFEYKYRPSYFKDKHYTLVLFDNDSFRLYTHDNLDGSCVDCIFQIDLYRKGQIRFINEGLDKEFVEEMRKIKIDKVLN